MADKLKFLLVLFHTGTFHLSHPYFLFDLRRSIEEKWEKNSNTKKHKMFCLQTERCFRYEKSSLHWLITKGEWKSLKFLCDGSMAKCPWGKSKWLDGCAAENICICNAFCAMRTEALELINISSLWVFSCVALKSADSTRYISACIRHHPTSDISMSSALFSLSLCWCREDYRTFHFHFHPHKLRLSQNI